MRETTLDELNRAFQRHLRSDQKVEVIGHQDKFVQ